MKSTTFLILIQFVGLPAFAQKLKEDSVMKSNLAYYFQIQTGALIGCNTCADGKVVSFHGATTHGVKIGKKLRVGAGVGFDSYYNWSTIPLYGSISWDLLGKKNILFAEFNAGSSLATWRHHYFQEYGYVDSKGGQLYRYGLGYRIKYDKVRISGGVAMQIQQMTSMYEYPTYYWSDNSYLLGEPSERIVQYQLSRLMVWIAVGLN
jgi:hypothetical protein